MKALLKLEAINDNIVKMSRQPLIKAACGSIPKRQWVARITGLDDKYKFNREFIQPQRDYSRANSAGSRGIYEYFFLSPGVYEVSEPLSWKRTDRYFVRATSDGQTQRISEQEVRRELSTNDFLRF